MYVCEVINQFSYPNKTPPFFKPTTITTTQPQVITQAPIQDREPGKLLTQEEILKVEEELEDIFDSMESLSGAIQSTGSSNSSASQELTEKATDLLKEATNSLEELQMLGGEGNSADGIFSGLNKQQTNLNVTNIQIISDSLEIFEKILVNAPPNITFTSKNELMAVVTVPTEPSIENPLEGQVLNLEKSDQLTEIEDDLGFYNYQSLLGTDLVVVVPASVIDQNLIKTSDCPTPVVFTEIISTSLQPNSSTETLAFTSIVVETCDEAANAELSAPVTLQFKKVYPDNFSTGQNNKTGPDLPTPTYSKVECAFFNTSTLSWETQEEAVVSDDPTGATFTCQTNHLTFFSLLFTNLKGETDDRDGEIEDNKALTIFDIFSNIFSIICCLITLLYILILKQQGSPKIRRKMSSFWRKIGTKPILRSYFQLSISLILVNVTFLFGQQFFSPKIDDEKSCVAVAHLLHWVILSFFFITLETAIVMVFAIYGKSTFILEDSFRKILILILPYSLAGIIVLICLGVGKSHGDEHYYGRRTAGNSKKNYLKKVKLQHSDDTLCFVDGNFFDFAVILPYAIAMSSVITAYLLTIRKLRTHVDVDQDHGSLNIKNHVKNAKKLSILFFTIGGCWLFLILSITVEDRSSNLAMAWLFAVFKFLQPVVLLAVVCGFGREIILLLRRVLGLLEGDDQDSSTSYAPDGPRAPSIVDLPRRDVEISMSHTTSSNTLNDTLDHYSSSSSDDEQEDLPIIETPALVAQPKEIEIIQIETLPEEGLQKPQPIGPVHEEMINIVEQMITETVPEARHKLEQTDVVEESSKSELQILRDQALDMAEQLKLMAALVYQNKPQDLINCAKTISKISEKFVIQGSKMVSSSSNQNIADHIKAHLDKLPGYSMQLQIIAKSKANLMKLGSDEKSNGELRLTKAITFKGKTDKTLDNLVVAAENLVNGVGEILRPFKSKSS